MSKYAWVLLAVVIVAIFSLTGYLNATGYFAYDTGDDKASCKDIQETYTDYVDKKVQECEPVTYTEYGCEQRPLEYSSNIDDLECEKSCSNEIRVCTKRNEDGSCVPSAWVYKCNNYKLSCKFGVKNLDEERGTWYISWYRECLPGQLNCENNPKKLSSLVYTLNPEQGKTSRTMREFEVGAEETIWAEFTSVPTKEFCGDITRTEQDCKFVTEQEPVEKVRTITVCD
ncbi:MAG: hypothetical protein ABIF08_04615 [Nanoarchaeota archaeon]